MNYYILSVIKEYIYDYYNLILYNDNQKIIGNTRLCFVSDRIKRCYDKIEEETKKIVMRNLPKYKEDYDEEIGRIGELNISDRLEKEENFEFTFVRLSRIYFKKEKYVNKTYKLIFSVREHGDERSENERIEDWEDGSKTKEVSKNIFKTIKVVITRDDYEWMEYLFEIENCFYP